MAMSLVGKANASLKLCALILVEVLSLNANDASLNLNSTGSIWFAPLDPAQRSFNNYEGSRQYTDLFLPHSKWGAARDRVSVFKIYGTWLQQASDEDLARQFTYLRDHGIALALEYGPLTTSTDCAHGINGEGSMGYPLEKLVQRISANRGKLAYLAMDEPAYFAFAKCKWQPEQTGKDAATNLRPTLAQFPGIKVGDIEPVGGVADDGRTPSECAAFYKHFIEAFNRQSQVQISFFQADINWDSPAFPINLVTLNKMLEAQSLSPGVIYNGDAADETDDEWIAHAKKHIQASQEAVGTPTAIFQSWHAHPSVLLPEESPSTFTALLRQYVAARTKLVATTVGKSINGALGDADGRPIRGARIALYAVNSTASGKAFREEPFITDTVPRGAQRAIVGIRINKECGCNGAADFELEALSFRLISGTFTGRELISVREWPAVARQGTPSEELRPAEESPLPGQQRRLVIRIPSRTTLSVNGEPFPLGEGSRFKFGATIQVNPDNGDSGEIVLIFAGNNGEISRRVIPIREQAESLAGEATTDSNGKWSIQLPKPEPRRKLRARFEGNTNNWPTSITLSQ
jgi:hypothetical protein